MRVGVQTITAPIKAASLSDLVQERLLADIVAGRFAPGERLNLDEISVAFGVSRTPIREAVQALSTMGFVDVSRNSRTLVAHWSAEDMRERVLVIGRLVAFLASAPGVVPLASDVVPSGAGEVARSTDFAWYLDLASQIVAAQLPRLAEYMQRTMIAPLRLFIDPDVLQEHGLPNTLRPYTGCTFSDLVDASASQNRQCVVDALTRYADDFATALTPPGTDAHRAPQPPTILHVSA